MSELKLIGICTQCNYVSWSRPNGDLICTECSSNYHMQPRNPNDICQRCRERWGNHDGDNCDSGGKYVPPAHPPTSALVEEVHQPTTTAIEPQHPPISTFDFDAYNGIRKVSL